MCNVFKDKRQCGDCHCAIKRKIITDDFIKESPVFYTCSATKKIISIKGIK